MTQRITPAGAGKTGDTLENDEIKEDHPRRCGENSFYSIFESIDAGSPPQVRGKHIYWLNPVTRERITPAGAGKTYILA